ncbi:MAG: glutamate 5-kinase [Christensenellaceae bacterium]|nr:glutamate 5-kinase [Christensenellaceae bacterium]
MRDFGDVKKIVIKVGSSSITLPNGKINKSKVKHIIKEIAALMDKGYKVLFVTSGAVGAGIGKFNLDKKPKELSMRRALAAVGQVELMRFYESLFYAHDKTMAQLLLTKIDFVDEERFNNLKDLCEILMRENVIPVINENDAVVINEIKVGDNDTLSALSCKIIDADLLIILSDIDGLYDSNPKQNSNCKLISTVNSISDVEACAGAAGSELGTGGMLTKIQAAKIATEDGRHMLIINGDDPSNISKAVEGQEIGTWFRSN